MFQEVHLRFIHSEISRFPARFSPQIMSSHHDFRGLQADESHMFSLAPFSPWEAHDFEEAKARAAMATAVLCSIQEGFCRLVIFLPSGND